jgi:hypothetical protein
MRLSDLLRCEVLDSTGAGIGRVQDVRCVREGPVQGAFGPSYRIRGLVVGKRSFGARLGYDRADVRGPVVLKVFFRRLHGHDRFVEWPLIAEIAEGKILLKVPTADLPSVPMLRQ